MTKEKWKQYVRWGARGSAALIQILTPCLSYILFEYVTGNLSQISMDFALLNIGWFYALYLILFAAAGSTRVAVPLGAVIFYILSLAETFVVDFRERPIMLWDVTAFRTAMSVSGNYQFDVARPMILAGAAVLALIGVAVISPIRLRGLKKRLAGAGLCLCGAVGYGIWFFAGILPAWGLGINMWEVNETYKEYGYVLSTAVSCQYIVKEKPEGYTLSKVQELCQEIELESQEYLLASADDVAAETEENVIQPVNIICIMNESFSDLKAGGDFETNQEYFPFLNSLTENTMKGRLCMPVFGSMTSNSEYEFLTGNSVSQLPANCIAYQFLVRENTPGLASTLKSQGYRTLAMHPYPGANWNRIACYRDMGFDEFLDQEAYEGCEELRNYVSDQADYEMLIRQVEEKEDPSEKLFIFNVTMQNHGGYEGTYDNFQQEVWLTGDMYGKYPKTDQYLSLMKRSDQALEYLISYFQDCDQPTMIVLFGDHQPSVEDEFFDEIAGMPSSQVPAQDHLMWYETPYLIWTNYDTPEEETGPLGAIYLSSQVLERAGLELTPYNRFLLKLRDQLPVIHILGCYDTEGTYYSWDQVLAEDSPYRDLVLDYEYLVYNMVYDKRTVQEMFFLQS